jgi:SAM-dependent methyltransferase
MGLLDDWRRCDPDALHRFLWSNHLAYAESYEIAKRFGAANIDPTRRILFNDATAQLRLRGIDPSGDIRSVFEVGCSMGYLLRHMEAEVFPSAAVLDGLDIDKYAIETGAAYLRSIKSRVKLFTADMQAAGDVMQNRVYDLVFSCGVLMYVNEAVAEDVVRTMFSHARHLVGLVCLAHPEGGDIASGESMMRASDGAFIHDVHGMIQRAGGQVVSSRWIGVGPSVANPSFVILAEPLRRR